MNKFIWICLLSAFQASAATESVVVVPCSGSTFHCSGVNWANQVGVNLQLSMPNGDPRRDRATRLVVNGSPADDVDLTAKTVTCEKETSALKWSLKNEGKYWRFRMKSECKSAPRDFDLLCQKLICTDWKAKAEKQ